MPIFVLGSVLGAIAGIIMIHAGIIPASCYLNIIAISMAAYFGAAEGAPFSARNSSKRMHQSLRISSNVSS